MTDSLEYPGDVLEGRGLLLSHGRLIAKVDYHLTIPSQVYFLINPTGKVRNDYEAYAAGFILVAPVDADTLPLGEYTLELADKGKKTVRVERRYKEIDHKGKKVVSFWVNVIES
jgi:hypothetical protein